MAILKIEKGFDAGTEYFIGTTVILGREAEEGQDKTADIFIHDQKASRKHARIIKINDNFYIEDLQSSNGTYLNGLSVTSKKELQAGDYIRIGDTWLSFGNEIEIKKINEEVKEYEFLQELQQTGIIGRTFKVMQVRLKRIVTLTLLPPHFIRNNPYIQERFQQHVRNLGKLNQPNIPLLLDFEAKENYLYYTTEYLEGETLSTLLASNQKLSLERSLEIALGVARGLAHAHSNRLLHQNLTPDSIFLHDNRILINGVGLANVLGDIRENYTGLVDNLPYLAPEQILHDKVDERTDIYALGVILYEMVTGINPFSGKGPNPSKTSTGHHSSVEKNIDSIVESILNDTPKAITTYNSGIPASIEAIIYNCLEKESEQRPRTCQEIADKLEDVLYREKVIKFQEEGNVYSSPLLYKIITWYQTPWIIWCLLMFITLILSIMILSLPR